MDINRLKELAGLKEEDLNELTSFSNKNAIKKNLEKLSKILHEAERDVLAYDDFMNNNDMNALEKSLTESKKVVDKVIDNLRKSGKL